VPVYEYRCAKGHEYEKTEGFSAPTQQRCTVCGARARRLISMPSVIFKGGGFYSTDNRRSSGESSAADTASADSPSNDSSPVTGSAAKSKNGHGHSHGDGDGGHTDDKPAKPAKTAKTEASVD
jgi:putative FmdB family regulatory protein